MGADTAPQAGEGYWPEAARGVGRRECLPTPPHALPATTAVTSRAAASPHPTSLATAKATALAA